MEKIKSQVCLYSSLKKTDGGKRMDLSLILKYIQEGHWKDEILKLRSVEDAEQQKRYKNSLPYFTPSGLFDQRKESGARGKPREKGGQLQERRQLLRKEVGSDSETRGVIPVEELLNVQPRDRGVRYKREAHANESKSEDGAKRHFLWAPFVVGW